MKIEKIEISNFRLLHSFSIDVENELSLVIGKNNTGKTSLLAILDKFLTGKNKDFGKLLKYAGVNRCSDSVSSLDNGTFLSIMDEKELILKML